MRGKCRIPSPYLHTVFSEFFRVCTDHLNKIALVEAVTGGSESKAQSSAAL